jgi:hypothetical protein
VGPVRETAARTPARRDRHVDLLRAVAICAVVLGHWLLIAVQPAGGTIRGFSALAVLTWAQPVTWLFQVMPVFFMVGGFANAASLRSRLRRPDRTAATVDWLLDRGARLAYPTAVLLAVVAAAAVVAGLAGVDRDQIGTATWLATLPLWFLVAYLAAVLLTPVMYAAHRRAGLAVPVLLLLPVAVGDVLRLRYGQESYAYGNLLFAWLALHQVGFSWQDGRLPARPRVAVPLLAGGLAALVLLTVAGPYPVSMVTVPGAPVQNSSPPTLALLSLAVAQLGLALLLRDRSQRWLERSRVWMAVVAVNSVVLTLFLWHLVAAVLVIVVLYLAGWLSAAPVGSAAWLAGRVPWVAACAVALTALVLPAGRVEARAAGAPRLTGGPVSRGAPAATVAGYLAVVVGLLWLAVAGQGYHGLTGVPPGAVGLVLAGTGAIGTVRAYRSRSGRAHRSPAR